MFTSLPRLTFCLSFLLFAATFAMAATYYVDYEAGNDDAKGTSAKAAWKHAPGDPAAAGQPKAATLKPGDVVIFKGGVQYRGTLELTVSGEKGKPIVYDGNTAGTFGEGQAIFDGSEPITDWKPCASAEDAKGNPRWKKMFVADIQVDVSSNTNHGKVVGHRQVPKDVQAPWQRVILIDGEKRILPISQKPKPKDTFYPDVPSGFYETSERLQVDKAAGTTTFSDNERLRSSDSAAFEDMFIAVHGGNNHTYFAKVKSYDPAKHQITFPAFNQKTYKTTKYAFFNHPKLIENPGEWAITPGEKGTSRVILLPERLENGKPAGIGYPVYDSGIRIQKGASYITVKGLLIQRFSGGRGGISIDRSRSRSKGVTISDCEVRFVTGHAGIGLNYCDDILVENCKVSYCPAWTTGVFLSRVNDYKVLNCRLKKNSGSGIRHYECKRGLLKGNVVLDHYGMHSSGMNIYEGCADLVLEGNYVQNVITLNRNAENIIIRNNIIDSQGRTAMNFAIWGSGRAGGRNVKNVQFLNNTFVNSNHTVGYSAGIFCQGRAPVPTGTVVKGNIMDRPGGNLPGTFEDNIYLRKPKENFMGKGCKVVTDLNKLFVNPAKGDFRRKPGVKAGADIPMPKDLK